LRLPQPPLLVITDRRQARMPLEALAAALFAGGCRWLSLREKDMPAAERLGLLRRLVALGKGLGAVVTVHDDLDAAAAAGTDGIHLSAHASARIARARLGGAALIGQSAHGEEEARRAAEEGADYVTLSPIFTTASKPGYGPALGIDTLREAAPVPVVALGGIEPANIAACLAAGAAGAAVMGGAMRAEDPARYVAALLDALAARGGDTHSQGAAAKKG
jgi:thiamine-phosphate pyrophosphorylase